MIHGNKLENKVIFAEGNASRKSTFGKQETIVNTDLLIERVASVSSIVGKSFDEVDLQSNTYLWKKMAIFSSKDDNITIYTDHLNEIQFYALVGYASYHGINFTLMDNQ